MAGVHEYYGDRLKNDVRGSGWPIRRVEETRTLERGLKSRPQAAGEAQRSQEKEAVGGGGASGSRGGVAHWIVRYDECHSRGECCGKKKTDVLVGWDR